MIDLATRITSMTLAVILLFQIVVNPEVEDLDNKLKNYFDCSFMLRERPGLQNITYIASDRPSPVRSMCFRALQEKDAKVNKVLDFVFSMTTPTEL